MRFNSIQEVIDHIESIPADQFIVDDIGEGGPVHCVSGHLNIAIRGGAGYDPKSTFDDYKNSQDAWEVEKLGVDLWNLVNANNGNREDPRRGALEYLYSLLPKPEMV